jgi:protein gp37
LIFVSDMSDSLSAVVPFDFLEKEIIQIAASPDGKRHRWLWLTKRPDRMAKLSAWLSRKGISWPDNLWAGTSITTQATTGRINRLLEVGDAATIRFLSVEPQHQAIDLAKWLPRLNWVIQGGESGHDAHPFDIRWAYELQDQCHKQGVPYFLKQLGTVVVDDGKRIELENHHGGDWAEWPKVLRMRQCPSQDGGTLTTERRPAPTKKSTEELSAIAKRAWKTRRANAAKRKRVDAAHKARETRHLSEAKKKRSEAAKKAWRTRRSNPSDDAHS